jgi:DNA repair exonuclease SbcCD ATPase subunit
VLQLLQKRQDLAALESRIKDDIEEPLRTKGAPPLPLETQKEGSAVVYGAPFFRQLSDLALKGVDYSALALKVGFGEGPALLQDVDKRLASITPRQASLKELVDYLEGELRTKVASLAAVEKDLADARLQAEATRKEMDTASAGFRENLKKLEDRLDAEHARDAAAIKEYKEKWDASNAAWTQLMTKSQAEEQQHKETSAEQQASIASLTQEVARLRDELKGPKTVAKAGPTGKVLRSDLVQRFAIIDRGSRDGIAEGQRLLVFREAPQGKKIQAGEVIVVKVFESSSRADIVSQDEMRPIVAEDLLYVKAPEQEGVASAGTATK